MRGGGAAPVYALILHLNLSIFKVEVPDLKETTSVLLQNMLDRLMVLEKQVENVVSQSASDISDLSEKVKSLNQSLRSFTANFTLGMYTIDICRSFLIH